MSLWQFTRRGFLWAVAALGAGVLLPGCVGMPVFVNGNGVLAFKRSGRGLNISNAAKSHNANRLYMNFAAANGDEPHPGDNSKVVQIVIPLQMWNTYFLNGRRAIFDFRKHKS